MCNAYSYCRERETEIRDIFKNWKDDAMIRLNRDLEGKILLLESYHGSAPQIETYLRQLQQLGAFEKVAGILLGTFTQMEDERCTPTVETLIREIAGKELPIAVTADIGHGTDAKAILIGQKLL